MSDQTKNLIQTFFQQFPQEKFEQNQVICLSTDPVQNEYFFYIESGATKMVTTSREGQNLVLHIFQPRSCFSLLSLIDKGHHKYDFIALVPTIVRKAPQEKVIAFFKQNPEVLYDFHLRLLQGLQGLLNRIEQSVFVPAYNQVAGLLLYFAKHFGDGSTTIKIKITHQEIAEWLGLSRENVSIQMKQLEREGLVKKLEKYLEIIDLIQLEKIANTSEFQKK
jgi:CRP/FNR family cyclic AMP-dependent transcriptional regulator